MDVLDTDFNIVTRFHDIGGGSDATDILIDGNVDVDVTRLTRRTFTANLLNPDGVWSPNSEWGGLFYVNRLIRLWRGIDFGSSSELVPIGTFMIDTPDVDVERGMSIVTLSGSDLWKKFIKSAFPKAKTWPAGTDFNTVIEEMASPAGITRFNLDPLGNRDAANRVLLKDRHVEQGDNRGEALAEMCKDKGVDIYFDTLGRLTSQDFRAPGDTQVVYTYDPDANNNLITVKASFTDENLYNGVIVLGTKDKDNIIYARVRDTDPTSVTSIDRIGERILIHESEEIGSYADAIVVAYQLFYKNILINEDITLETICNPAFEGNDVIHVREVDFSQIDSNFRIKAFTIPMSTSRQTIRVMREIRLT